MSGLTTATLQMCTIVTSLPIYIFKKHYLKSTYVKMHNLNLISALPERASFSFWDVDG